MGLERTLGEYVDKVVSVFREVRRVLKPDGTLWLNMGDCHHSGDRGGYRRDTHRWENCPIQSQATGSHMEKPSPNRLPQEGLKDKDLVGMPWRVALALQADGWWLRSDIIWAKPNPMPESVTDRPTRAHEYVFLLTRSARYFYDADAIRTPIADSSVARVNQPTFDSQTGGPKDYGRDSNRSARKALENAATRWSRNGSDKQRGHGRRHAGFNDRWDSMTREEQTENGANARTVWNVATEPFRGAHYATMPTEIARRCILAGSRKGDTVFDPFAGAGTTLLVADRLGRDAVGLELGQENIDLAWRRIKADAPMFHGIDGGDR